MVLTVEVEPQTVWSALLGIGNAAVLLNIPNHYDMCLSLWAEMR